MSRLAHVPLVILGAGYTGRFIYRAARRRRRQVFATSRSPSAHLSFAQAGHRIFFDLHQPGTWSQIPPQSDIVWCFPALPQDVASTFAQHAIDRDSRLILLGSTSAYRAGRPGFIDEGVPVNRSMPRVASEECLRTTYGATVLRLSGLYGPERHVFDWIRKGKIKNSQKYVNLIHIEDVAELCLLALRYATPGSTYIVSDGQPRTWAEICRLAAECFQIAIPPATTTRETGKRLSPQKILSDFHYRLKHPDLFTALAELESGKAGPYHSPPLPALSVVKDLRGKGR
ncbi:MAG: hypothetical protein OXB94_11950 [Nitrospira sp.]|nr:hypothetical protein [Nitrospira sp.]